MKKSYKNIYEEFIEYLKKEEEKLNLSDKIINIL